MNLKNKTFIGTWNLRALYQAGALVMMHKLKIFEWMELHCAKAEGKSGFYGI